MPNFRDVGSRYASDGLLDAPLNPSRQIADGFSVQVIETRRRVWSLGVVARETPSLLVRGELGDELSVSLDQVRSQTCALDDA